MNFFYLIGSIIAESGGKTFDKINLKKNKIDPRQALLLIFITMASLIALYIILAGKDLGVINKQLIFLIVGIACFSFLGNVFDEMSLQRDDLSLREPLVDFEPIATGFIAYLLFPEERNIAILAAFILGTLIVRWGLHRHKLNKNERTGIRYMWLAVLFYAIVPVFYKEALNYISPEYLALFRTASISILILIFFKPKRSTKLNKAMFGYGLAAAVWYAFGAIVSLYAIKNFGLVITMLFLMLGPALRYLAGQFVLKEKVRKTEVLSSLMLTLVVAIAAFFK